MRAAFPARPPFVVVEGLDGVGKSTVAARLADRLGAERLATPPQALRDVREAFDAAFPREGLAATLFYAATVAAASDEARALLAAGRPVVLDRYWLSTLAYAYALGRGVALPAVEAALLRPDLTVRLVAPREVRAARLAARGHVCAHDRASLQPEGAARLEAAFDALEGHPLAGRLVRLDTTHATPTELAGLALAALARPVRSPFVPLEAPR